jgi:peptidyl-prolyl cis-trans isomerase C
VSDPQVLAQHILVKTEGLDAADKAQALEKIKSIRARVVAAGDPGEVGQAFTKAAQEHSDCPSGAQGGSLGWFGRGMMVPEFDQAAFGMKCGEVSDVIKTQFGYHIILKTDEKAGGPQTLVDVADQIRDLLRHEARGRAMDAYVAELREKVSIEYR